MYKLPPYSGSYQCSPTANSTFRGLEKRLPEKPLFPIQFQIYSVARYFFRPSPIILTPLSMTSSVCGLKFMRR